MNLCHYCTKFFHRSDLRPYGPGGAMVCHPCGTNPEHEAQTAAAFDAVLEATEVVGGGITTLDADGLSPGFTCPTCGWEPGEAPTGCATCRPVVDLGEKP